MLGREVGWQDSSRGFAVGRNFQPPNLAPQNICGLGAQGYEFALAAAKRYLTK